MSCDYYKHSLVWFFIKSQKNECMLFDRLNGVIRQHDKDQVVDRSCDRNDHRLIFFATIIEQLDAL